MTTLWPIVLAHIQGGVTIIPYGFDTLNEANAFRYKFGDDGGDRAMYLRLLSEDETKTQAERARLAAEAEAEDGREIPEMPSGFTDDHEGDTWVLIEGAGITYVDGDEPTDGRPFITEKEVADAAERD